MILLSFAVKSTAHRLFPRASHTGRLSSIGASYHLKRKIFSFPAYCAINNESGNY